MSKRKRSSDQEIVVIKKYNGKSSVEEIIFGLMRIWMSRSKANKAKV